jgi:hypothetical protein
MAKKRFRDISRRELLIVVVPAVLLVVAAFWLAAQFVRPAPPKSVVMGTGAPHGAYEMYAANYRSILARFGIELVERPSAGAVENLERLADPEGDVDLAFVQGGLGIGTASEGLVSLGSFYYEPVWVFYRGKETLERLTQLKGKRIAIGAEGSGTRKLALDLLRASGIDGGNSRLLDDGGLAAVGLLGDGKADAIFLVGPAKSAAVWSALYGPGFRLMSFAHADAFTRQFPFLAKLTLPEGGIDVARAIPPVNTTLVAPMATIVARDRLHPALIDLILGAAEEVHGGPGVFQRPGDFPNAKQVDFPLSKEAERHYKSGARFLQRYLPFWLATLIERMLVLLVPLVVVLIPVMRIVPGLYSWRMRSRIYRHYGDLGAIEREVAEAPSAAAAPDWLKRLDAIELEVEHIRTPLAFANQLYILREHIDLVRAAILKKAAERATVSSS